MEDLISIIITVYNNEKTLKDCILSVISQTYRNIEIVIVDDGSTDESSMICDELLLSNSKLQVHHQIHSGLASARNKGLELASGKYVTFLNASDLMKNTLIENLKNMMDDYDVDVSICRTFTKEAKFNSDKVITLDREDAIRQLLISDLIQNNPYAKLFNRDLFDKFYFDDDNAEILYKIFRDCNKVAFMNNSLYQLNGSSDVFPLSSVLNKDVKIMAMYPDLKIYCKCNIVKTIQDEFYNDICNNKPIPEEQSLYEMFKKIISDDEDDIVKFFSNVRKAHMYLLADDLRKYKMVCPVLPELD